MNRQTPNPYTCLHGNTTRLTPNLDRCNQCLAALEWCDVDHSRVAAIYGRRPGKTARHIHVKAARNV